MPNLQQPYDCIIIGGGIGGLLNGLLLQQEGLNSVILEKNAFTGGYLANWTHNGRSFNYGINYYHGFEQRSKLLKFFERIGVVSEKVKFERVQVVDKYIFPDFEFSLTADEQEVISNLVKLFPKEESSIHEFFDTIHEIYLSVSQLTGTGQRQFSTTIIKYARVRYHDYLHDLFKDEKLIGLLSSRIFGSEIGMITMSTYLAQLVYDGLYELTGTDDDLISLLSAKYVEMGGTIRCNSQVETIDIEEHRAQGVFLKDGHYIAGDYVVSASNMKNTFTRMLPGSALDTSVTDDIKGRQQSLSSYSLFLVLEKLPSGLKNPSAGRTYIFDDYDIRELYHHKESGKPVMNSGIKINLPGISTTKFDELSEVNIRVEIDMHHSAITGQEEQLKEELINVLVERIGLDREEIIESTIMTPAQFEDLTLNQEGSASGWSPNYFYNDLSRLERKVAENFSQTGCWDQFGSGVLPIFFSANRIRSQVIKHQLKNVEQLKET